MSWQRKQLKKGMTSVRTVQFAGGADTWGAAEFGPFWKSTLKEKPTVKRRQDSFGTSYTTARTEESIKAKKIFRVTVVAEHQPTILRLLGYRKHPRKNYGFIRDIEYEKRWHAYPRGDTIEVHLDKKINKSHVVLAWGGMQNIEQGRFMKAYKKLTKKKIPPPAPKKRKFKPEYAPNLVELQKQDHGSPIVIKKKESLLTRLLNFIKKI